MGAFLVAFSMAITMPLIQIKPHSTLAQDKGKLVEWVMINAQSDLKHNEAVAIVEKSYLWAKERKLDPVLVLAQIKKESGFRRKAISKAGAVGLTQVMPKWHPEKVKGKNLFSITHSIEVGTLVLAECRAKFKGNYYKALNCYSGGAQDYSKKIFSYRLEALAFMHLT